MNSLTHKTAMAATVAAFVALGGPAAAHAKSNNAHPVRADVKNGTLVVSGGDRDDAVALRLAPGDPTRIQVDVRDDGTADFSFARAGVNAIQVDTGAGVDSARIDDANGAFTDAIPTSIAGGRGDDSLRGGTGAERFSGGDGRDSVVGGRGNDSASLGRGNDTFTWNPGDASDTIEGRRGRDTMLFNGSAVAENIVLSDDGGRLRFTRDVANITMDTDGVEKVDFNALGGTDNIRVNDLRATDVTETDLDLAGTPGGSAGDGAVDNVFVAGTNGNDRIRVDTDGSEADVTGLAAAVSITNGDPTDRVSLDTLLGRDRVLLDRGPGGLQVFVD